MDESRVSQLAESASRQAGELSAVLHKFADLAFDSDENEQRLRTEVKERSATFDRTLNEAVASYRELKGTAAPRPDESNPPPGESPTPAPKPPGDTTAPTPPTRPVKPTTPTGNPKRFNGLSLFVNPNSSAARAAEHCTDAYEARVFGFYAAKPIAFWYGGWAGAVDGLKAVVAGARKANRVLTVVLYNIPNRDASGGYSAGGASYESYKSWCNDAIRIVGDTPCIWIIEPDALADLDAVGDKRQQRLDLIKATGMLLSKQPNSWVYLDAGNYGWQREEIMAPRLKAAGIDNVDGFSANVSGFGWQADTLGWCTKLSNYLGDKHFVVDTSRNGNGPWKNPAGAAWDDWCNPPGRLLGLPPQVQPTDRCDAFLWIKPVGESDGACKGAPPAGQWHGDYAIELARRAVPR